MYKSPVPTPNTPVPSPQPKWLFVHCRTSPCISPQSPPLTPQSPVPNLNVWLIKPTQLFWAQVSRFGGRKWAGDPKGHFGFRDVTMELKLCLWAVHKPKPQAWHVDMLTKCLFNGIFDTASIQINSTDLAKCLARVNPLLLRVQLQSKAPKKPRNIRILAKKGKWRTQWSMLHRV